MWVVNVFMYTIHSQTDTVGHRVSPLLFASFPHLLWRFRSSQLFCVHYTEILQARLSLPEAQGSRFVWTRSSLLLSAGQAKRSRGQLTRCVSGSSRLLIRSNVNLNRCKNLSFHRRTTLCHVSQTDVLANQVQCSSSFSQSQFGARQHTGNL
jgi:hypothetical protein